MKIEAGQIWERKTDGTEAEVLNYIERNNAVRYKYPDGYVTDCAERFKKSFEFVRNKGDAQVINHTDMEAMKKSFLDCMSKLAGMIPKVEDEDDVMDKCGKCGSGITLLDKAVSRERGIGLCSPCLHQDNLRREKDEDAQMIKPKYPSPIKNKDLTVKTDDKGVITGIVHHKGNMSKPDMVNRPPHYKDASGIECKEITCHRKMSFSLGNAIKYLYRAGSKGDSLEDLKKAEWYLRVAYLNDEKVPKAVEVRLLEVAAHRKTAAGRALNLIRLHEISAAYQAVKKEIEKLEAGDE